jgi:hypothetical protein
MASNLDPVVARPVTGGVGMAPPSIPFARCKRFEPPANCAHHARRAPAAYTTR